MYILITNKDVIHEHKGIREAKYTIVKMMIPEKLKKQTNKQNTYKIQFTINRHLFNICLCIYH